jgi:hypothetical protein
MPFIARTALALTIAASLAGCSMAIGEGQLLRPVAGGELSNEALQAAAPVYTLSRHTITADDGTKLHAVHMKQPGAVATVLYFGGNGYTIGRFGAETAQAFASLNADLMIVDHRGYGLSQGTPTARNIQADGIAAFDYLSGIGPAGPIVVHGQSLGSFIAGHVGASRPAGGVVLESSVTTTEEWAKARAGNAPVRVTVSDAIKGEGNSRNMPLISEPLLLLVGSRDAVTPPKLSESLYQASPLPAGRKTLAIIPAAGHNDVLLQPAARQAYAAFLGALR